MLASIFPHQEILTTHYNSLHILELFLLGPFMIATGAAMSPAIAAQFPRYQKIFRGRQTARSLHFLGLLAFILFIIVHIIMVTVERFPENMGNIVLGNGGKGTSLIVAVGLFSLLVITVLIVHVWATGISLKRPRVSHLRGHGSLRTHWTEL
jgi:methionine sulfoxide reductase catalytic subunit